jgi:hypothetical protein
MPTPKKKPAVKAAAARVPVTMTLSREVLAQIDEIAVAEDRPRSKVVEIACRQFAQSYLRIPVIVNTQSTRS